MSQGQTDYTCPECGRETEVWVGIYSTVIPDECPCGHKIDHHEETKLRSEVYDLLLEQDYTERKTNAMGRRKI